MLVGMGLWGDVIFSVMDGEAVRKLYKGSNVVRDFVIGHSGHTKVVLRKRIFFMLYVPLAALDLVRLLRKAVFKEALKLGGGLPIL